MLGSSRLVEILDGAAEPVSLTEAKAQLRVDYSADDTLIESLVSAARHDCENYLYTSLIPQRRKALFDCFGPLTMMGPVGSVESVQYLNTDGTLTTLASEEYRVVEDIVLRIEPVESWPATSGGKGNVTVTYTTEAGAISPVVKTAILLKVGDMYANREDPTRAKSTLSNNMLDLERVMEF